MAEGDRENKMYQQSLSQINISSEEVYTECDAIQKK